MDLEILLTKQWITGGIMKELGDDWHRFIFGNLRDAEKEAEIRGQLNARFTETKMKELFPQQGMHIEWQTEPVAA